MENTTCDRGLASSLLEDANTFAKALSWRGFYDTLVQPEDVAQEALVRLFCVEREKMPNRGWLFKTVRSVACDAGRALAKERKYVVRGADLEFCCRESDVQAWALAQNEDREPNIMPHLKGVLTRLSPRLRQVLVLYSEGWSYLDIARTLGISIGTVRSRLHHARKKARLHLSEFC